MSGPVAHYLDGHDGGRLHLQHGPIDLVIGVDGGDDDTRLTRQRTLAFRAAHQRFQTILDELVSELDLLRQRHAPHSTRPKGAVAGRMVDAVALFSADCFITPMAAVAGAVADEVLAAMIRAFPQNDRPQRIYVNNGGDIALHLDDGAEFAIGIRHEDGAALGRFTVQASEGHSGLATSGRGGRSLSLGIADSVTVVARSAAAADAAATLIANAVDLPGHPAIARAPADSIKDDSDLGSRLVVTGCDTLAGQDVARALRAGETRAQDFIDRGLISRAALFLQDQGRVATATPNNSTAPAFGARPPIPERRPHA
ncbi:UPF0280 family protein [Rhizobium halophytocola]|uniref:ApbE superfamily uncharacterized protein (UPF0280 family) n=1 Tax=Rhizobium halophytocola TaxID=735519 RepID=A0ABS4DU13_9HYPH|nr:UPF0280 family protein [Rhizobium halophytocola]MBP1849191.1 ApbE superfamily uncharacterized protein (UPF0280 family) [Rhizobium halophytocola]